MSDISLHIDITNDNVCKIIRDDNGKKLCKYSTIESLLELIRNSINDETLINQPNIISAILPKNLEPYRIIQTKTFIKTEACWYIILRKNVPASFFIYNNKKYKNVNMPYILFAIKIFNNRCVNLRIVSTESEVINKDTLIYTYPFSNVNSRGIVCLGDNNISQYDIKDLNNIYNIPEMFLSMPNSTHSFTGYLNYKGSYEKLLDRLTKEKFNNDVLYKSDYKNYINFINNLD